jgi:hypothetical protein
MQMSGQYRFLITRARVIQAAKTQARRNSAAKSAVYQQLGPREASVFDTRVFWKTAALLASEITFA